MDWEVLTNVWKKQNLPPWLGPQCTTLLLTSEEENCFLFIVAQNNNANVVEGGSGRRD